MTRARATTEHRIRGQIGQPAACMIESKEFSGGLVVIGGLPNLRRIMADGACHPWRPQPLLQALPAPDSAVHRSCGQDCGQPLAKPIRTSSFRGPASAAGILGSFFFMQINGLSEYVCTMTALLRVSGQFGELVDFPSLLCRGD